MRALVLGLIGIFALSACGRSFCVGPIGNVAECYGTGTPANPAGVTTGELRIVLPNGVNGSQLKKGTPVPLTAQGGAGNYRWRLLSGKGSLAVGSGGTQDGVYFIGPTVIFTGTEPNDASRVEVEDSNRNPVPIMLVTGP